MELKCQTTYQVSHLGLRTVNQADLAWFQRLGSDEFQGMPLLHIFEQRLSSTQNKGVDHKKSPELQIQSCRTSNR